MSDTEKREVAFFVKPCDESDPQAMAMYYPKRESDHTLLLRLMCEGKLEWIRDLGTWAFHTNGKCYDSTLDDFGCPRLTDELRKAIEEAGL
jgi:hypothetical protein